MKIRFLGTIIGFCAGLVLLGDLPSIILLALLGHILFDAEKSTKPAKTQDIPEEQSFYDEGASGIFLYVNNIVQIGVALLNLKGNIIFSELNLIKTFLVNDMQIDENDICEVNGIIEQTIKNKDKIDINNAISLINQYCRYDEKVNILHMLFVVAIADKPITADELDFIIHVAHDLTIQSEHLEELKNAYCVKEIDAYKILGISTDASVADIKKAYRKLVMIYHPDKLTDETDEAVKQEKIEKFHQIVAAYKKALSEAES